MFTFHSSQSCRTRRRGVILVLAAILLVLIFAFVAFSVDVGYMTMTKAQLQNAADAASLAGSYKIGEGSTVIRTASKEVAYENQAAGAPCVVDDTDIEIGVYDYVAQTFTINETAPNAVKVTTRVRDQPLFFAPVINNDEFDMRAEAIAMLNPRDIVFVVDLSGSMNDDTEPCWATAAINSKFAPLGYPDVANPLMQDLYNDFGFGTYPGVSQYIGEPLGVSQNFTAIAEMTQDDGPLAQSTVADPYRILETDDEYVRKEKAYRWIIDNQIAVVMPAAQPTPNSSANYAFWEKYLDYVLAGAWVGNPPPPPPPDGGGGVIPPDPEPDPDPDPPPPVEPPPPTPPQGFKWAPSKDLMWAGLHSYRKPQSLGLVAGDLRSAAQLLLVQPYTQMQIGVPRRGSLDQIWVPWGQDGDQIWGMNNPNYYTFPTAEYTISNWVNRIGYVTYVQYMMDWGRDRSPDIDNWSGNAQAAVGNKTPLSVLSPYCPRHAETVAGHTFNFPPREQPMHAVRRSLIAALEVVRARNAAISSGGGDNVAIVTFDALDADHDAQLVVPLTPNYTDAMAAAVNLQAVSDIGSTTATEAGLELARAHLKPPADGGGGRHFAKKVIVLLTDGVPNAWRSTAAGVNGYVSSHPNEDYYDEGYLWLNAALMQTAMAKLERTSVFSVGMGLGTDYDFMDRVARMGGTAEGGLSVRGSGNPAEYEERLTEIFEEIIRSPGRDLWTDPLGLISE